MDSAPTDAEHLLDVFDSRPSFSKHANLIGPLHEKVGMFLLVHAEELGDFLQLAEETYSLFCELHC